MISHTKKVTNLLNLLNFALDATDLIQNIDPFFKGSIGIKQFCLPFDKGSKTGPRGAIRDYFRHRSTSRIFFKTSPTEPAICRWGGLSFEGMTITFGRQSPQ